MSSFARNSTPVVEYRTIRRNPQSAVRRKIDGDELEVRAIADACEDEARRAGIFDIDVG